ncbi:CASP-like protein 4B1 [Sorghum bicolor]|uniref:CASP-like protein 4B1 n=2 Tax=Sorghum bicolor TaxID=4558 RepID=CSPL3_SORBI|nr:CASP-like protein 4B1 [Sorghum bicolor]C5WNF5.1 RecName: Full=CASP-like protein 4B1; Short=SbCASPL4B1 [Sorghum bicolor]|eukprot:XP_002468014.1 CASP-like protein 4B1 [Sorghum bicolor]
MAMVTTEAAAAATTAATAAAEKPQDVEKPDYAPYNGASTTADGGTGARARRGDGGGGVVDSVVARWRREDMLDKSPLALHAAAAIFAFVALVLVASNQHGDWMQFDRYQEYRYLLAIASLALLYSLAQAARHAHRMRGGVDPVSSASARLLDFVGDQVVAYLLMSALSAAVPITNRMRSAVVNNFTDATAAAISMAFFSFVALALSAVVSGYKLSKQTYM